jgi:Rieske Fe-S protein
VVTRRTLLAAGAAAGAASVLVLAGCSKGSESGSGENAPDPGASGAGGSADGSGGGSAQVLAKVSQVPIGNALSATMNGRPILISQPTTGTIVTFSAICTHQGCTVAPAHKQFHCPCHGSIYDAATGAVVRGPASRPLTKIPTHIADGDVVAGAGG